jgi:Na+-transporting NADH:ubiquinone oxidoreductase subunit F
VINILLASAVFTLLVVLLASIVMVARAILSPSIEVTVTLNRDRRLTVRSGRTLIDALGEAGITVPSACAGAATCGLCQVEVSAGGGQVLPTEAALIARQDLARGARLACQVVVRGDLSIQVPEDLLAAERWDCRVESVRMLAPLIREVVLELPAGKSLECRPGAFMQVTAPPFALAYAGFEIGAEYEPIWERLGLRALSVSNTRPETRAYAIANTPRETGSIILCVRIALPPPGSSFPPGIVSSYLFGVRPGDRVACVGPFGHYGVPAEDAREMVLIGGGVGMVPLRSLLFDQLERAGTRRRISFWYGARTRPDLFHVDDFDRLQAEHDNFRWTAALSDPAPGEEWDGPVGFIHDVVDEHFIAGHPAPEDCLYYLCGPPVMIRAVRAMLDDAGVERENIFCDDFGG